MLHPLRARCMRSIWDTQNCFWVSCVQEPDESHVCNSHWLSHLTALFIVTEAKSVDWVPLMPGISSNAFFWRPQKNQHLRKESIITFSYDSLLLEKWSMIWKRNLSIPPLSPSTSLLSLKNKERKKHLPTHCWIGKHPFLPLPLREKREAKENQKETKRSVSSHHQNPLLNKQ